FGCWVWVPEVPVLTLESRGARWGFSLPALFPIPRLLQAELPHHFVQRVVQLYRCVDLILVNRYALYVKAERYRAGVILAEKGAEVVATDSDGFAEWGVVGENRRSCCVGDGDAKPADEPQGLGPSTRNKRKDNPPWRDSLSRAVL